jgi:hypothetical protein
MPAYLPDDASSIRESNSVISPASKLTYLSESDAFVIRDCPWSQEPIWALPFDPMHRSDHAYQTNVPAEYLFIAKRSLRDIVRADAVNTECDPGKGTGGSNEQGHAYRRCGGSSVGGIADGQSRPCNSAWSNRRHGSRKCDEQPGDKRDVVGPRSVSPAVLPPPGVLLSPTSVRFSPPAILRAPALRLPPVPRVPVVLMQKEERQQ